MARHCYEMRCWRPATGVVRVAVGAQVYDRWACPQHGGPAAVVVEAVQAEPPATPAPAVQAKPQERRGGWNKGKRLVPRPGTMVARVLDEYARSREPLRCGEVAWRLGAQDVEVRGAVDQLVQRGFARRAKRGLYEVTAAGRKMAAAVRRRAMEAA